VDAGEVAAAGEPGVGAFGAGNVLLTGCGLVRHEESGGDGVEKVSQRG
jgi:hypothetical protein